MISKRRMKRLERADKVAREVRYLIANDGRIIGRNYGRLDKLLESWMRVAGNDKYIRPGADHGVPTDKL